METEGCERGSHHQQQAPIIAGNLLARYRYNCRSKNSPKYERKFSQTFTKRPSPEWKPAVRRYSVETGQAVLCQQDAQHIGNLTPDYKFDSTINISLQEYLRDQLLSRDCCSFTTRHIESTTSDLIVDKSARKNTCHDGQVQNGSVNEACQAKGSSERFEEIKKKSISETHTSNPDTLSSDDTRHANPASKVEQSASERSTMGQGYDSELRHGGSRTTHMDTTRRSTDKSRTSIEQQNKLTGPATTTTMCQTTAATSCKSSTSTCCTTNVSADTRPPPIDLAASGQQQQAVAVTKLATNDRRSFVAAASATLESVDALATVSMDEKLQLQDKQRKHVILSMALKHLIAPEQQQLRPEQQQQQQQHFTEPSPPESVEQSLSCGGDFRSRSNSFGTARSGATRDAAESDTTSPCVSMIFDDICENEKLNDVQRWPISEDIAESHASIFLVSSNLHQVFDRQQKQRLDSLVRDNQLNQRLRQFKATAAQTKSNTSRTQDEICQIKLQAYKQQQAYLRQLQSRHSIGANTTATKPTMRQLVTSRLEESLRDQSSPSECIDSLELAACDGQDRPKSTAAESNGDNQGERTPARRSCSAFGKPGVNCDSLYSGLASNQCESNLEALIVESWLDDHPNFTHDYFMRKAPRQMIDDWLVANAKVSNTNLSSQLDLRSLNSMSRPLSQLSLSSQLRGGGAPSWKGFENTGNDDLDQHAQSTPHHNNNNNNNNNGHGCIRPNRSNSQSAAGLASSRALAGSLTPIRKISATDFETRSGSGFLRPMLSKTPDGRLTFLPQTTNFAESPGSSVSSTATKMGCVPEAAATPILVSRKITTCGDQSKSSAASAQLRAHEPQVGRQPAASECVRPSIEPSDQVDCSFGGGTAQDTAHDEGEVRMIFELVKNIYDDLDIRTLFHKILKNIAVLINADRSSLFLVCGGPNDPNRRLVSQLFNIDQDSLEVCDMDESISIPWGVGLVGYVAESGESVNIVDCYEDPRFTDVIDQRTGYVTRNMLCAPILDKRNEIVGVAQVINKRDGNPFSKNDEIKFKRYLQFCGIGLRNAQSYEQCQLENRRNQVLLDLARMVFEEQSTIEQVVHRIMLHTQSLLDCERCQVLLIDNGNDELDSLLQMRQTSTTHCSSTTQEDQPNCSRQTEWRPQCSRQQHESLAVDSEPSRATTTTTMTADEDERSACNDNLTSQHLERQNEQLLAMPQPRLFSLVFDLECDGNEDPIVYETRSGDDAPSPAAAAAAAPDNGAGEPNQKNRAFPINIGITGYVATTGETLNIENAHEHERFDSSVDENSDFRHKSILCMPIRNGQRQIIGVIQLINKKNGQPFNKNDEDLFEAFAIFCGLGIHNTLMYERVLKVMAKQRVTFEVLSYHATAPLEEARKLSQEQVPSCYALNLASLKFNDFSLDEQYMLKSCLRFFLDLDLMRRFQIDHLVFCNWILSVQKNYRKVTYHPVVGGNGLKASPVRYHNWRHAFNVSQMMFAILVNTQICHSLGELETLALLIACLCHDLDHRGTNNSFQIKSASPLAELYSTSTMEHHHFDQCVMILNSQGNQILSNLSPEEYSRVIILLEEAILATDLANYFQKRDHFFQLVNSGQFDWRSDPSHRSILRCMLMTACDVAAITKPWPVQKVVADLVMSEFYQQGDIEKNELKIEPIDMMNRDKMSELPSMQISFIDTICAPIYTAFARLFPQELDTLLDGCLTNRSLWREVADSNTKPEIPLISYLNCDTNDELQLASSDDGHNTQKLAQNGCRASKSDTHLPRKLSLCVSDNAGIRNKNKNISLSGSSDRLIIPCDLHDQASQETMIPSGNRCNHNYESCDSEPIESPHSPVSSDGHRNSF